MSKKKDNIVTPRAFIKYDDLAGELDILSKYIGIFAKIAGKTIVIKCGNGVLANREAMYSMAKDIAVLQSSGVRVIVVHGGGAKIGEMLKIVGGLEKFIDGERVIDEAHFHIIEMVLKGSIAPHIVSDINHVGGVAISISGRDNNFIKTDKMRRIKKDPGSEIERIVELGLVGEPISMDLNFLDTIFENGMVPVISPIGINDIGKAYVMNADVLAGFIAEQTQADLLLFLTDFDGISNAEGNILNKISSEKLKILIDSDAVHQELKIKAISSINALKNGVGSCSIVNGNEHHITLIDLLKDEGVGTVIFKNMANDVKSLFPIV